MTDFRVILKSNIKGVELNKKKVKIDCHNNKAGQLVVTTLNQNIAIFDGHKYDIKNAANANDFNVKFDSKEAAEDFYDNLVKGIMNNKSIKTEEPQNSGWQNFTTSIKDTFNTAMATVTGAVADPPAAPAAPAITSLQDDEKDTSSNMPLIIGGAVVLLVIIGLLVWKMKK